MTFPPSNEKFLNPATFSCVKCGQCCRPIVKVSQEEIKRIEQLGLKRNDFLDYDPVEETKDKNTLKQINGVCMFLKREDDEFVCKIYNNRPDTCRKYPFITGKGKLEDCRPKNWKRWMPIEDLLPNKK